MPFVVPSLLPAPLQGQALNRHVQQWMQGVIDVLPGDMIRPYDQSEPPVVPARGEAWMAFTIGIDEADWDAALRQSGDFDTQFQRQETLRVTCNFYDTGTNGFAMRNAALLRDGGVIPQNVEMLAPIAMVGFENPTIVPSLLSTQWLYRVDLPFRLRRQIDRTYATPAIEEVGGFLRTDVGLPDRPLSVEIEP